MSEFERGFIITLLVAFVAAVYILRRLGDRYED